MAVRRRQWSDESGQSTLRYHSLQYLRAAAVIGVVVLHSHTLFIAPVAKVPLLSDFGWIGVRLFFVISGFIVADRIARCDGLADYLVRRFFRVFPLYFAITLLAALISNIAGTGVFVLSKTDSGAAFDPSMPAFYLKSALMFPQDDWPLFAVGWSLEFEIVFYALFGLSYFLVRAGPARWVILGLGLLGTADVLPGNHFAHPFMFYFLAGCLARDAHVRFARRARLAALAVVAPATGLWLAHLYGLCNLGHGFTLASALSFASILILGLGLEPRLAGPAQRSVWVLIGDASFSIYLGHWFVFRLAGMALHDLDAGPLVLETLRILIAVFAVAVSIVVYRWIETPLNVAVFRRLAALRAARARRPA